MQAEHEVNWSIYSPCGWQDSYTSINRWLTHIDKSVQDPGMLRMLVGNKSDLTEQKQVNYHDVKVNKSPQSNPQLLINLSSTPRLP